MNYQACIEYLYGLEKFGIKFGLTNIQKLIEMSETDLRKLNVIHIGGTNGKGSTVAMIGSILNKAGYDVGVYTSPHLIDFRERIVINTKKIPKSDVINQVKKFKLLAEQLVEQGNPHPTYFEIITAMALNYFVQNKVDFAVLEVGLGGRLDATNIITPLVSVITTVSLEHTDRLGNTVEEIAFEKAGIIKNKVPVITAVDNSAALSVISKISQERQAKLFNVGTDIKYTPKKIDLTGTCFDVKGPYNKYQNLNLTLLGRHQIINGASAIGVIDLLRKQGYDIPECKVKAGLESVIWRGRLEILQKSPMVVLDCAHNHQAIKTLKTAIQDLFKYNKLWLVIGIMKDKNIPEMIKELAPAVDQFIIVKPKLERAAPPEFIEAEVKKYNKPATSFNNVDAGITYAISSAKKNDLICVTGSMFTVGEAMEFWET